MSDDVALLRRVKEKLRRTRQRVKAELTFFHFAYDPEEVNGWKSHPVRVRGPRLSRCHAAPTLLVQSMEGGFVTANCSECGAKDTLTASEFLSLALWVSCPECKRQMQSNLMSEVKGAARLASNYGYACDDCRLYVRLADLLPHWEDVMPGSDRA
jgi:hypothetical protein